MSKIIEFIAPVDAMRGNLSGRQSLTYGEGHTSAYDTQVGSVTAANNYAPRFVGAKRSRDEKKYFQVRTTSSVGLTAISKKSMAVLAGASLCFLAANKNLMIISILQSAFVAAKEADQSLTYRKWLMGIFYPMLANKLQTVTITSAVGTAVINNPWVMDGDGENLTIASKDLIKFASVLADPAPYQIGLGQFGQVLMRWNGANPDYRNSKEWSSQAIPLEFNPDFQGPISGHHFVLQPDLMDGNKMMLQEKNGDTLLNNWRIKDGETYVTATTNAIPNHDYILEPYA